jgi:PAS domain S-box-containing protein
VELYLAIILSFLEITFIITAILLLHFVRKRIGSSAFYITLGALFVFIQFISVTELKVMVGYPGADFYVANSVLFLPLLAAVMVVYITEGTLATQKLIVGTLAFFGFYIYLCYTTSVQCSWYGFKLSQGPTATTLNYFLAQSLRNMAGTLVALCFDLFLIPILYQRLRNLGARLFISVLGSLMLTQIFDSFIQITITYWNSSQWMDQIGSTYIARGIAIIWLSVIITAYLKYIEDGMTREDRKAFDIVFAFIGSYSKTRALKQNLIEWEDRYRMVVENASDMIFIANRKGEILDVNSATVTTLNYLNKEKLIGKSFFNLARSFHSLSSLWEDIWSKKKYPLDDINKNESKQIVLKTKDNNLVDVDIVFSRAFLKKAPVLIIFCRNITEKNKLLMDKTELTKQLYHAQRVESLGRLAGGVSHEFNNILHAIQGHVDIALLFGKINDESTEKHLSSVMDLVGKASNITAQLLGFARKREFRDKVIDLRKVLNDTQNMFLPMVKGSLDFSLTNPNYPCNVNADPLQLQQVFLNLFINAMDALHDKENDKKISVTVSLNKSFSDDWKPLNADAVPENYYVVVVEDNGEGMKEEVMAKIFEPFFTTKEIGKGTGMGLSMVYGEITNHKGLIHVSSTEKLGTTFYIYLPVWKSDDDKK